MEEMKARIKMLEHRVKELEEKLERILNYISI
jgi:polyhydroxyalkanoate synthesis regulator phasin